MGLLLVAVLTGVLAGLVAYGGWWLALSLLRRERDQLLAGRAALEIEWQRLDQTRRVRETFRAAHQAMRDEAQAQYRQRSGPTPP